MIGAIAGDISGSYWEWYGKKDKDFDFFDQNSRFTDDTVLTLATAKALMSDQDYTKHYQSFYHLYPNAGYGNSFSKWALHERKTPYNSYANGAAMRVSPIGWCAGSIEEARLMAKASAEVTHDHPIGIAGAQAVAETMVMARRKLGKADIKSQIETVYDYDLSRKLDDVRPRYCFELKADESVPEAIIAFLESTSYEDAVRNAISLGGDADTQACIAGAIAEAYYEEIPDHIQAKARDHLDPYLLEILDEWLEWIKH